MLAPEFQEHKVDGGRNSQRGHVNWLILYCASIALYPSIGRFSTRMRLIREHNNVVFRVSFFVPTCESDNVSHHSEDYTTIDIPNATNLDGS